MPPKSTFPEVELFINNVRKDILEPKNLRKPRDNLTKEERLALRNLTSSENVIRIQEKGSRFVILSQQEYQDKMLRQLNNDLHYDRIDSDPTLDHFEVVKNWGLKWFSEGQISQDIATWVVDLEPKPGVAFGNVKTHKTDNPLRLITSCCGTAIERISAFTEFYLKPLSQNLPSFVKDSTDFINKIEAFNPQGPLPAGSLLVSWDVVSMFPNIDNNLGITAVRKALDSRQNKFPSTDCIVEAVEICLRVNNCQFFGKNFVQKHGTAMGPKNACSYADLAMGIIDEKAKFEGSLKPLLWWRYRDDIFDIWTQGLPKLLEFTDYINSLYPTIKFELVHSHSFLHVLDLTLHLRDGFIITDIYSKPTDSHLYLPFYSSHPPHCKRAIPYGVALRIKRNCSTNEFLQNRQDEYKGYLRSQNYPGDLVDKQFQKALSIPRPELLTKKNKSDKKVFPLVLDYNPILPDIQKVIRKHLHLLHSSSHIKEIFPAKSIFPAYRRTKNLKETLAPSKFRSGMGHNLNIEEGGCSHCGKRCDLCKNVLLQASKFQSSATGRYYPIRQNLSCSSKNVIYLATCNKCNLQYVGSTSTEFKVRFRNHKSSMLNNRRTCELAAHFNSSEHDISQICFILIEQIRSFQNSLHLDQLLLTREAYWTAAQLFTLNPHGLNKRREFRSKHRINYNN